MTKEPIKKPEETQQGLSGAWRALALLLKEEEQKGSKPSDIQKIRDVMAKIEHRIYADKTPLPAGKSPLQGKIDGIAKRSKEAADKILKTYGKQ